MGTTMPPSPARNGSATRLRTRSSPMSNSRRASSPTTRKNSAISPEFTNWRRSMTTPELPTRKESCVAQNLS